jgi:hypothetical protein
VWLIVIPAANQLESSTIFSVGIRFDLVVGCVSVLADRCRVICTPKMVSSRFLKKIEKISDRPGKTQNRKFALPTATVTWRALRDLSYCHLLICDD